jgi:hypothetical protein
VVGGECVEVEVGVGEVVGVDVDVEGEGGGGGSRSSRPRQRKMRAKNQQIAAHNTHNSGTVQRYKDTGTLQERAAGHLTVTGARGARAIDGG